MTRFTTTPRPATYPIRLGALASLLALTIGGAVACAGEESDDGKVVDFIPASEYVEPVAVQAVANIEVAPPVGFIVPEGVTYGTAESAFKEKRYLEATAMFEVVAEGAPDNPWNHYMLGLSAWKAGERERAERAFTAALDRDPRHLKSELNLSRVLLEMGRASEALPHIEKGLAIDSGSADAWRLLGRVRGELKQLEPALTAYRMAIVLDEKDAWAMNNMGLLLINAGRFQEALGPLARATEIRGEVPVFQNNLGMALERTGHYTAAATAYRAALASDSTYARATVSLARVERLEEETPAVALDLPGLASTFVQEVRSASQGTVVMVPPAPPEFR